MVFNYLSIVYIGILTKRKIKFFHDNKKRIYFIHNLFLTFLSSYMFFGILYEITDKKYKLIGNNYDINHVELEHYIWIFYLSKYYEFIDTFLLILNNSKILFLHVYHHSTVVLYVWMVVKYEPGGDYYIGPMLNSWVHIWMYLYYLLASMMNMEQRRKYLWWNKYLTQMQILQFIINTTPDGTLKTNKKALLQEQ
jgi:elongation of very long chain fatty acids protein 4